MPNQHLLTCKSHYALCTSHFALCSFEIETLSKPSPKSPLEKFRGAKSSDRSAVFSQYQYCPNSWPIESTAVPSPSRDTKRRQPDGGGVVIIGRNPKVKIKTHDPPNLILYIKTSHFA